MKKIKTLLAIILILTCINYANNRTLEYLIKSNISDLTQDSVKVNKYQVTATMYYPVASQCDASPNVTAGMYHIPKKASEKKWIAMSRDMISRWGGEFKYGDFVKIEGAGHKDGVYMLVDTMNKRFTNRIDFLETAGTKPYKFENVTLTKV